MQSSALRDTVRAELASFAWSQWAQLGVLAPSKRHDNWAADPEALLLFTLEVGRSDPRLFDETLDWLLANQRLVGVQRLRNLAIDDADRGLVEAAIAWVAHWQPRNRRLRPRSARAAGGKAQRLFRTLAQEIVDPDPAFLNAGFLKPNTEPSRKSIPPDPTLPISFAFRTRLLFGVGSRAEVIRYLLTAPAPDASTPVIAEAAGYARRNVSETLAALASSRLITAYERGNENRYRIDRATWGQLFEFGPDAWPTYREWPRLLLALRRLARWVERPDLEELSDYMRASEARTIASEIEHDLAMAGVPISPAADGERYWDVFAEAVSAFLSNLNTERS